MSHSYKEQREGGKDEERLRISGSEKERICGSADENAVPKTSQQFPRDVVDAFAVSNVARY